MAWQEAKIGTKNGTKCLDGWSGPMGVRRQLNLREEYQKNPLAVHNRLIIKGDYKDLANLHEEFGKPKEVVGFEIYESDISTELVEDIQKLRNAFVRINEFALQQAQNINLLIDNIRGDSDGR